MLLKLRLVNHPYSYPYFVLFVVLQRLFALKREHGQFCVCWICQENCVQIFMNVARIMSSLFSTSRAKIRVSRSRHAPQIRQIWKEQWCCCELPFHFSSKSKRKYKVYHDFGVLCFSRFFGRCACCGEEETLDNSM